MKPIARNFYIFYFSCIFSSYLGTLLMWKFNDESLRSAFTISLFAGILYGIFQIFMVKRSRKRNPGYEVTPNQKKLEIFIVSFITIAYFFPLLMKILFNYPVKNGVIIGFLCGIIVGITQVVIMNYKQKRDALNISS